MEEYNIPTDYFDKGEAENMCTVSTGIYLWGEEAGEEKGVLRGKEQGKRDEQKHSIQNLLTLGQTVEQIIQVFHYPESLVYEVAKEQHA